MRHAASALVVLIENWLANQDRIPLPLHSYLGWTKPELDHWIATGQQPQPAKADTENLKCQRCNYTFPSGNFGPRPGAPNLKDQACIACRTHLAFAAEQEERIREGQCLRKKRYRSYDKAIAAALRHSLSMKAASIYLCPHCNRYHLTTKGTK